jgi:hypothetical protein
MFIGKQLLYCISICLIFSQTGFAQQVPAERITDWTHPGSGNHFVPEEIVQMSDFNLDISGVEPCDSILQSVLTTLDAPTKLVFSAGTYLFNRPLVLPDSIILEGEADEITLKSRVLFKFGPGEYEHGILIQGSETDLNITVESALNQGMRKIHVPSAGNIFSVGNQIRLYAMDDDALVFSSWALHASGQILRIIGVEGDSILFDRPLRRSYSSQNLPKIFKQTPRKQVHIQCVDIERITETASQTSNIMFDIASDCSISGAESYRCNFAHVTIQNSYRVTAENSYFHDAFAYGSGGQGYGIVLQSTSSDCYVYANTFNHLRHSMLLQSGVNGNVLAYNYSSDPYWTGGFLPANSAGDLVLHGNYPYMNLFEGNVVQHIVIDNSHGINGPFNTIFRNRAELYGIFMNNSPASPRQNFIGNQVSNTSSFLYGLYSLQGIDHYQYGNTVKGTLTPSGTAEYANHTLYGYSFSDFYPFYSSVPPMKLDNWQSIAAFNEADYRNRNGRKSICSDVEYINPYLGMDTENSSPISVYPNPSSGIIHIVENGNVMSIEVLDLTGKSQQTYLNSSTIDLSGLSVGIYLLKITTEHSVYLKKIILSYQN